MTRARIDLLRVEGHHDVQSMLTVEFGGRQIPAHAEIDRLRAEVEKMSAGWRLWRALKGRERSDASRV